MTSCPICFIGLTQVLPGNSKISTPISVMPGAMRGRCAAGRHEKPLLHFVPGSAVTAMATPLSPPPPASAFCAAMPCALRERLDVLALKLAFTTNQTPAPEALKARLVESNTVECGRACAPMCACSMPNSTRCPPAKRVSTSSTSKTGCWPPALSASWKAWSPAHPLGRQHRAAPRPYRCPPKQHLLRKRHGQLLEAANIETEQGYRQRDEAGRLELLNAELLNPRPLTHSSTALPAEATEVRKIKRSGQAGPRARCAYYRRPHRQHDLLSDLLTVYCKEVGLTYDGGGLQCTLPVVPFETYDLERAPGSMPSCTRLPNAASVARSTCA